MKQLNVFDAFFLYSDQPRTAQNVTIIWVYDRSTAQGHPVTVEEVRDHIVARAHLIGAFRKRVVHVPGDIDFPWWVDDPNFGERATESYAMKTVLVDGGTGIAQTFTTNTRGRRVSRKEWITESRQKLWEVRQLLHYLRGRQISFYLPTFSKELTPSQDLANASTALDVVNNGYTTFTQSRQPRDEIRVVETDGTTYDRSVVSSAELSADEERLTVSSAWPSTIAKGDVERIEILEKVRLESDRVRLTHGELCGDAVIVASTRSVLE